MKTTHAARHLRFSHPLVDLCLLLIVAGCLCPASEADAGRKAPATRPNVLLIVSDDQRPDTIHALGNELIRTPNLDRLVDDGVTFRRATCANPLCVPSRAELLTGASGFRNGVFGFRGQRLNPEMAMWPHTMRQAGYRTGYVGKWHTEGRPSHHGYENSRGLFAGGGGRWAVPTFDWNGRRVTGYRGWVFQTDGRTLMPEKGIGLTPNISTRFADAAIEFIRRRGSRAQGPGSRDEPPSLDSRPFFLHVNFTAPHDPLLMPFGYEDMYDPAEMPVPENFLPEHLFDHGNFDGRDEQLFEWPRTKQMVREELAVYYAVISHMDSSVGRILKALDETGQRENTIVIFTSDHGLAVGSHGLRGKQNMYEHTIGVPLIIVGPGIPKGKQSGAQCYLRDLYPTVCDLAGIPIPETVEGKSLKPVLTGEAEQVHPHVFGYFRNFQRMIRTDDRDPRLGGWKLIHYPHLDRTQLFHLPDDPHELNDLSSDPEYADVKADLRRKLTAWQKQMNDPVLEQ